MCQGRTTALETTKHEYNATAHTNRAKMFVVGSSHTARFLSSAAPKIVFNRGFRSASATTNIENENEPCCAPTDAHISADLESNLTAQQNTKLSGNHNARDCMQPHDN